MFLELQSEGYRDWVIFDNFGDIIVRTTDLSIVFQLLTYVWNQNIGQAVRTIHYYDVLAVQPSDSDLIDLVLREYGRNSTPIEPVSTKIEK